MPSPYTSSNISKAVFDLHCGWDYPGDDILGIYVYAFEDCMGACVKWNSVRPNVKLVNCTAVSYDSSIYWPLGNCFLKGNETDVKDGSAKRVTDSAALIAEK